MAVAIIGWLYRNGLRRGTTGGHWPWLVVALAARLLRSENLSEGRAAISMEVKAGERLIVTARKPEPKS